MSQNARDQIYLLKASGCNWHHVTFLSFFLTVSLLGIMKQQSPCILGYDHSPIQSTGEIMNNNNPLSTFH